MKIPDHDDLIAKLRRMAKLLTVIEAATLLRKHPETVYQLINSGSLIAIRDGNRWKIDPHKLADWIERRCT